MRYFLLLVIYILKSSDFSAVNLYKLGKILCSSYPNVSVSVKLHSTALANETLVDRRGLDRAVARSGDIVERICNRLEIPAEAVENRSVRYVFGQIIVCVCRLSARA